MADRFICAMAPFDYNPVVLRKPFRPHLAVDALPSDALLHRPVRHYPHVLDIDPGPRVEWDFNPPKTCAARHTIRNDPSPCLASVL